MSIQALTFYPTVKLSRLLIALENGSRPTGGVRQLTTGVPSLGGEHVLQNGKFNFENIKFVPRDYFNKMRRGIINKYDVLVVKDGATTGKTAFVGDDFPFENATVNEHVFILRVDSTLILPEYLYFFLSSEWGQAQIGREFHGGAIGGINQTFAEYLEVPLPSLIEQNRIVIFLRQLSNIDQWRRETIQVNRELRSKIFEWFFGNGKPLEGHQTVTLKTLLTVGLSSGYSPATSDDPIGIPVFNLSAITDHGLDETQLKFFQVENYEGKGSDLVVDDLLISRSNTLEFVGRVGRYKGAPGKVIYPDTMIRIRVGNHVDAIYLEYFLRSPYMRAVITQLARGTSGSMKKISQGDINNFVVYFPDAEKRKKFSLVIDVLEKQEDLYLDSQKKTEILFDLITTYAFSGKATSSWREENKDSVLLKELERDALLKISNEKVRKFETAVFTFEELESLQKAFGNFAVTLANYNSEILTGISQQLDKTNKSITQSLVSMSQNLFTPFLENFRQSLQNIQPALPSPTEDEINRQIDLLPLPQEKRAIHDVLDITSLRVLKLAHASPAYFTPEDLTFGGITSTHTSTSLRVLDSLGFVRLVEIDGVLRYHLINSNTDAALKPDQLQ